VVYLNSEMGAHIQHVGWREWHPGETTRLEAVFYAERGSTGSGATLSERDPHDHALTQQEPEQYQPAKFLCGNDNWNPVR
jgi:Pectinesterase